MATNVEAVQPCVQLWIRFNCNYEHALSIPVETCHRFSLHPLTWLRFLGYAIYGKEGYISCERDGEEVDDYRPDGGTISPGEYYYMSEDADFRLLDPKAMDDRTSSASDASSRPASFKDDVHSRDVACIMTGSGPDSTTACHILPHAKRDQYVKNLVSHRQLAITPPLDTIDDIRNGILLMSSLHTPFGASKVAFLQTPNFAMETTDVPLVRQPQPILNALQFNPSSNADQRLTFQCFKFEETIALWITPHNSDAKQSRDATQLIRPDWPPRFFFDVAYGCAAIKTWGTTTFLPFALKHTEEPYYRDGDYEDDGRDEDEDDDDNDNHESLGRKKTIRRKKTNQHSSKVGRKGTVRFKAEDEHPQTKMPATQAKAEDFDVFDAVMRLWTCGVPENLHRAHLMKEERIRKSVQRWRQSIV